MTRRLCAALAVCAASVVTVVAEPVAAQTVVPEPVARKMVTNSPQTTGPTGSLSWGLDRIDQRGPVPVSGSRTYNFANTGLGVNIYVLDSGVNATHPEFGGRVVDGWSYRASTTALNSYKNALLANQSNPNNGIEPCANDGTHAQNPVVFDNPASADTSDKGRFDNDGHGTHVAGIAAGDGVGVAKEATIIPVRSLDSCGNGTRTMILEGLAWILADHDANEKAVLNLSVGFGNQVQEVDDAIIALMNEGVLVTAAAGNGEQLVANGPFVGVSACGSTPASTPGTVSIGAIENSPVQDKETEYSNYGTCVDIFSPGSAIPSAYPYIGGTTNTYANLSGTSMATPFVTGALARYLQLLSTAPTNAATGNTAAWIWLNSNATVNAVTYYNTGRAQQTPNKLLYVPSAPAQVSQLTATPAPLGAVVAWQGVVPGATYTVTASPGNATCSVVGGSTCSLSGLAAGTTYTVSVTGSNTDGVGPTSVVTVTAGAPPEAPSSTTASSSKNAVTLSWAPSTTGNVSYVVASSPSTAGCSTTLTTCSIPNLRYGVNYVFTITVVSANGVQSTTPTRFEIRPGFTVKKKVVARRSRTLLSSILTTASKGKKTWSESGRCSISAGRLVGASTRTTCTLVLKVAKWRSYPAMSTTLKVSVK